MKREQPRLQRYPAPLNSVRSILGRSGVCRDHIGELFQRAELVPLEMFPPSLPLSRGDRTAAWQCLGSACLVIGQPSCLPASPRLASPHAPWCGGAVTLARARPASDRSARPHSPLPQMELDRTTSRGGKLSCRSQFGVGRYYAPPVVCRRQRVSLQATEAPKSVLEISALHYYRFSELYRSLPLSYWRGR